VSRTERSGDLRERMQRVAAKPRQTRRRAAAAAIAPAPKAGAARSSRARPVADAVADDVVVRELPQRPSGEAPVRRPRSETAFAWAMWELTTVPARRWEWFKQFARGRESGSMSAEEASYLGRVDESLDAD